MGMGEESREIKEIKNRMEKKEKNKRRVRSSVSRNPESQGTS